MNQNPSTYATIAEQYAASRAGADAVQTVTPSRNAPRIWVTKETLKAAGPEPKYRIERLRGKITKQYEFVKTTCNYCGKKIYKTRHQFVTQRNHYCNLRCLGRKNRNV
jgi:hypothetical protein